MADLPDLANVDYVAAVNRAIDHVTAHLDAPPDLGEVAAVAGFSPFHFHRIFKAVAGETLHAFSGRVRLERALHLMAHTPQRLTDIALACGFASSSDFSRCFRAKYGVPPRRFDVAAWRRAGRDALASRVPAARAAEFAREPNPEGFVAVLRRLPARRVAYRRVFDAYSGGVLPVVESMRAWAHARGLAGGQWLGYQWDDPEIVPLDRCRYDVGVEVPEHATLAAPVLEIRFPAMTVVEVAIRGGIDLELRALDWLYATWLPSSGRLPDSQPCFEAWDGEPFADGVEQFALRLQIRLVD